MVDLSADRYCIIGAGPSGLATAKTFLERGIAFDCLEREPDIGGLWNIATNSGIVYETTHLVSCISATGFDDLPMLDADYPEYPSHARVLGYFRDYVAKFGLQRHRSEQGHAHLVGQPLAPALPEERHPRAAGRIGKCGHVLDDA
jgi:cation diffusion facilitator CzcD-associated flavoprotein CzcO